MTTEEPSEEVLKEFKEFIIKCGKHINSEYVIHDEKLIFMDPLHISMVWRDIQDLDKKYVENELDGMDFINKNISLKLPDKNINTERFVVTDKFSWLKKEISGYKKKHNEENVSKKFDEDYMSVFFKFKKDKMFIGWLYNDIRTDDIFSGNAISVNADSSDIPKDEGKDIDNKNTEHYPAFFKWKYMKKIVATLPDKPLICKLKPYIEMKCDPYTLALAPYYEDYSDDRNYKKEGWANSIIDGIEESLLNKPASVSEFEVEE
jgi:hypothetical protein